ncbi:MAG: hypothetical protein J7L07_09660 [Candidatus Odinarchaeota archaeon]|nr:hypothetical protein [Candidatus Odinarchaeota archaeon]
MESVKYDITSEIDNDIREAITKRVGNVENFLMKSLLKNNFNVTETYSSFKTLINDILEYDISEIKINKLFHFFLKNSFFSILKIDQEVNLDSIIGLISELIEKLNQYEWLIFRYMNEGILTQFGIIRYMERLLIKELAVPENLKNIVSYVVSRYLDKIKAIHEEFLEHDFLKQFLTHIGIVLLSSIFSSPKDVKDNVLSFYEIPIIISKSRILALTTTSYVKLLVKVFEEKYKCIYEYFRKAQMSISLNNAYLSKKGSKVRYDMQYISKFHRYITAVYYPKTLAPLILIDGRYVILVAPISED